jgi:RNA polymerase sigma-70 factor (ECF subfamily)
MPASREADWKRWMLAGRGGDDAAYRAFLTDVSGYLRGWARGALNRAGRSAAEAEDIVQETLIALHTRRHTWDPGLPVGPWLHGIARHKLIDALRKRGGREHVSVDDFAETLAAPAQEPELPESDILKMVAALPEKQAGIVRAIFVDGQRAGEVAARLGMNEGAVRVALHRALKALAAKFGER